MLLPRVRPLKLDLLTFGVSSCRQIVLKALDKGDDSGTVTNRRHKDYYYMNEAHKDGWVLKAAFCPETRRHWALGHIDHKHPLTMIERDEEDAVEFLMALRPFIKIWRLRLKLFYRFMKKFTRINTLRWD